MIFTSAVTQPRSTEEEESLEQPIFVHDENSLCTHSFVNRGEFDRDMRRNFDYRELNRQCSDAGGSCSTIF